MKLILQIHICQHEEISKVCTLATNWANKHSVLMIVKTLRPKLLSFFFKNAAEGSNSANTSRGPVQVKLAATATCVTIHLSVAEVLTWLLCDAVSNHPQNDQRFTQQLYIQTLTRPVCVCEDQNLHSAILVRTNGHLWGHTHSPHKFEAFLRLKMWF